ncbi:hypothetical protein OG413_09995 [Streptomyces sp. NBC_01433]|uniref:hypothetical protein n=1 Tax=Streptomyces sp. NBC_01433 TaxID=2903864 RepID=UPI002255BFAD|nr:hypothetical protein [Streptomyces sp. NBC_01433]MCX4675635.1 hypothetical protein [Streptomyces sp. NBC_01433]
MTAFARTLGMSGIVRDWSVGLFLSPYYAYEIWPDQRPFAEVASDTADWQNRFGPAWRVSWLVTERPPFQYGGLGPYYVDEIDRSWADEPGLTGAEAEEYEVVVLADGGSMSSMSFLDGLVSPEQIDVVDVPTGLLPLNRVTIRLGRVRPLLVESDLAAILRAFGVNLYSTHHLLTSNYHLPWPRLVPW